MTKQVIFQNETNQTFQNHTRGLNKTEKFSILISLSWGIVGYQSDTWGKLQHYYPRPQPTASKINFIIFPNWKFLF